MITEIEEYFARGCGRCARFDTPDCATQLWSADLARLRALCLAAGLQETVKWGQPCYMHAGRNVAIIGAFRDDLRLSFFEAALLSDPDGALERQGPNTRHADCLRFTTPDEVDTRAAVIHALLAEAKEHAASGRRAPREAAEIDLPDDLIAALDADTGLAEAFHALTPGRQRSWAIHVSGAKASATRAARIARGRDKILAGKGATER